MEFHSKVAGVSHDNADGSNRQELIKRYLSVGDELLLLPDPYNPVSPAAIALIVVRESGLIRKKKQGYQIGFVTADLAPQVHEMLAEGKKVRVFVSGLTGGTKDKPTRGVNLLFKVS